MSLTQFFDILETFLDVKQQADDAIGWLERSDYSVYGYHDSNDLSVRELVYVGIDRKARAASHWSYTQSTWGETKPSSEKRRGSKKLTIQNRRLQHQKQAA